MLINLFYCYLFIVILLLLCLFIVSETKLPLWGWWFFWLHLLTLTQRGIFILRLRLCEGILGQTAPQSQQHISTNIIRIYSKFEYLIILIQLQTFNSFFTEKSRVKTKLLIMYKVCVGIQSTQAQYKVLI